MHRQPQLITRIAGQRPPGAFPQPWHLHHHQRELSRFEPVVAAEQNGVPDRHPDGRVGRPDVQHRSPGPGQPAAHRIEAGESDRRFARAPEPFVEGRQRGGAAGVLSQPDAFGGQPNFGVCLVNRTAGQHVDTHPLDVVARGPAGPQQCRIQGSAVEPHIGGRDRDDAGAACVLVRHGTREQADVDRGAQPGHFLRRLPFPPVGGGDQPPGQRAADETVRILARRALVGDGIGGLRRPGRSRRRGRRWRRLARGGRGCLARGCLARGCRDHAERLVPRRRAGQHDPLDQIVRPYDANNELAGQVPPRGHRPFPPQTVNPRQAVRSLLTCALNVHPIRIR